MTSFIRALNEYIEVVDVSECLVEGRTILVMKDPTKGAEVGNYRPIACLNLIWKLLIGIMGNTTFDNLEENGLLLEEQKGSKRKSKGTKDRLVTDRCILRDFRKRKTNLSMAWVNYKKAYHTVPYWCFISKIRMVGLIKNIKGLIK